MRREFLRAICVAFALFVGPSTNDSAQAQSNDFPVRPITLIVPFPAGGPSDALARSLAHVMSENLGQTIIIQNIAGAGGIIGLTKVLQSSPDGYTMGFGTVGTHVANVALYRSLPYNPLTDFAPVGLAGEAPTLLLANASFPASNLQEFANYAKTRQTNKLTFGSAGIGSISHFACGILLGAIKLNATHVPYRGVAPAMNDLMGGYVDFMCDQTTTSLAQIASGKIKALAVLTDQPLPQLPGVATAASAGYADVNVRAWNALFVPKDTPQVVIERLNQSLRAAVVEPHLKSQMAAVGVDLPAGDMLSPAAVSQLIVEGIKKDVPVLRARGEYLE
jgi:tripartite-type tricarboxylate transporter receptor subunit TctC